MDPRPRPEITPEAFLLLHPCHLVDGDKIQLPPGLPADLVELARTMKPALLVLLQEDAQDLAEERAGILEFCAGFSRSEAERRAGIAPQPLSYTPAQESNSQEPNHGR